MTPAPLVTILDDDALDSDGDIIAGGERVRQVCEQNRQQHFVKVNLPADISPGNFQRCPKIIATDQILPKWELRWYRGDHQSISGKFQ